MNVLVVDNEQANVDLLVSLLHDEGLQQVTAETDSRCVASLLPSINPDLVLLDLYMPHVDGHVVLEEITRFAADSYLPVLVLTADITTDSRDRALAHGARDFLTKPLDLIEVTLRVANLLETRHLYTVLRRAVIFEDRERIARDLHDTVMQRLFTIGSSLSSMSQLAESSELSGPITAAISDIDRTIRQIRTTIFELGSADIDHNVRVQILSLVRQLDPIVGFGIEMSFIGPVDAAIPVVVTEHLLATTREALTNIGRHANATAASVTLSFEDGLCRLQVTDNGSGLTEASGEGLGLSNLKRRAEHLQGRFTIGASKAGGTSLIWELPITPATIDLARMSSGTWDYFL
jgi:signal transduction histidine kinase